MKNVSELHKFPCNYFLEVTFLSTKHFPILFYTGVPIVLEQISDIQKKNPVPFVFVFVL